jgi:hypothetical protein
LQLDPSFKLFEILTPQLQQLWFERRSPVAVGKKLGFTAVETAELAFGLPGGLSRLLNQVERGEVQLNVNPLRHYIRRQAHRTDFTV